MELEDYRVRELVSGGDCRAHWHSEDRVPTQDFLHGLQNVSYKLEVSSDTILAGREDFVFVDTSASNVTVTLPRATGGREITVVKTSSANTLTVNTTGTDLINGSSSQSYTTHHLARTFKQTLLGWTIVWGYLENPPALGSQVFPNGEFYDTTNQYDGSTSIPYAMRLNQTSYSHGVSVESRNVVSTSSIGPSSTVLTCTGITSGRFYPGMLLSGTGVSTGTYVFLQLSSTATPLAGPYTFVSGGAVGAVTVTLNSVTGLEARQFISGTGVPANTRIVSVDSGTNTVTLSAAFTVQATGTYTVRPWGYQGTYSVSPSQTVSSTTISGISASKITVAQSGRYNIQLSAQFVNTDTHLHDVDVWFKKNDVTIDNSNTSVTITASHAGGNGHVCFTLNKFVDLLAGDYVEIVWHTNDPSIYIEYIPEASSPIRPAAPSVIATVQFVSAI